MKLKNLIQEVIFHQDKESLEKHEREMEQELRNREQSLGKKIDTAAGEKLRGLRNLEKLTYDISSGKVEVDRISVNILKDLANFAKFIAKKIEEYKKQEVDVQIPIPISKELTASYIIKMDKASMKTVLQKSNELEKKGVKTDEDLLKALYQGKITPEELEEKYPELDPNDLEEFVHTISQNPELKKLVNDINKRIERLNDILARTKYMSSLKEKKPIAL